MSEYKYVYGQGRTALNVPETDIRYAMENTKSNAAAARFLKISFTSYKKYAKMYTDRESGKTLYELHKNQFGVGIPKDVVKANKGIYSIDNILTGKHPKYPIWKLRNRLLALAILPESCNSCGYAERRITDDTVPLRLDHIDGDITNHCIENLQMLCINCYYQQSGNPYNQDKERYWNYNLLE
tara:strand:- start:1547 stop:2095 length:549 start_codon:yes stop_codon:yes gene_type:complete